MKKGKRAAIIIGVLLLATLKVYADDFTKNYHKEYAVTENTILQLNNRYGNMHIENWDKNIVDIKVVVAIKTSSKTKARNAFERIEIEFKKDGDLVSATTKINESIRNTEFSINYIVMMPKDINIELYNKYGDLFLNEVNGHADINVKYGSFTINKLNRGNVKPLNFVSAAYSNGVCDLDYANWVKLEVRYSKISVGTGIALMISSKYSSVKVKKAKSIVSESKYDHPFRIGAVRNFVCTGGYSGFEIGKLYSKLEMDLKYSNIDILDVDADFELVKLNLRYGKADINIPENVAYELKAEAEYGSVKHPSNNKLSKIVDGTESKVWGIVGDKAKPKAKIIITSKYGNVRID